MKQVVPDRDVADDRAGLEFEDFAAQVLDTLMLEEVAEPMYRIDRALFHITSYPGMRRLAGAGRHEQ